MIVYSRNNREYTCKDCIWQDQCAEDEPCSQLTMVLTDGFPVENEQERREAYYKEWVQYEQEILHRIDQ